MKKLDTKAANKWFFIKDNVIFDIKTSNQGDWCAVQGTDGTIPSILVIQGIKLIIKVNFKKDYYEIKKLLIRYGTPAWCLVGEGYTVEDFEQVDFTEEFFNQIKDEIVWEEATEAARKVAAGYGYEVSNGLYDAISDNITPA